MPSYDLIAIIFNPKSTGRAAVNAKRLQHALLRLDSQFNILLLPTEYAGHAEILADTYARQGSQPLLISASGDGGYNEVINGVLAAQRDGYTPTSAVLPSGNANDHARSVYSQPLAAVINGGTTRQLDVLELRTEQAGKPLVRYAHSYVGLGITSAVAVELNKTSLTRFRETVIFIKALWRYRPIVVEKAGETLQFDHLVCSTVSHMAKFFTVSRSSQPDDGSFELTALAHTHKLKLLYYMWNGLFTELGVHSRLKRYECRLLCDAHIQYDGEVAPLTTGTDIHIRIRPGMLRSVAAKQISGGGNGFRRQFPARQVRRL